MNVIEQKPDTWQTLAASTAALTQQIKRDQKQTEQARGQEAARQCEQEKFFHRSCPHE